MRALNSRRPQPTSTRFCCCLAPRSLLCLLLLLFVVDGGGARSLLARDEEAQLDPGAKLSTAESDPNSSLTSKTEISADISQVLQTRNDAVENEKIQPEEPGSLQGKVSKSSTGDQPQEPDKDKAEQLADQSPGRSVSPLVQNLQVEKEETTKINQQATTKCIVSLCWPHPKRKDEDATVAKKRRRNDVALKPEVRENAGVTPERIEEIKDEGIRRFDDQVDADGAVPYPVDVPDVATNDDGARQLVDQELVKKEWIRSVPHEERIPPAQVDRIEGHVLEAEEPKEQLPSIFRKSETIAPDQEKENVNDDDETKNRGHRYLDDPQGKSRRKSSTVYLNAEEKKISDGEQQSIVDGQIKKLISIRDDALDAQKVDNLDEAKVLTSKRQAGLDEAAITQENVRLEQGNKVMATNPFRGKQILGVFAPLRRWKEQAVALQDQIRNKTFLFRLREQPTDVLPGAPKFTENQLLDALEQIALSKRTELSNSSYLGNLKDLGLTEVQLRIIGCAEQLLAVRERQSFVSNVVQCVQGLSVFNCIRIFVWPIVVDNLPESVTQNFGNLPIEINVFDLFQGNRPKSGRAQNYYHQIRLIAPESVVYNILQDALESYPADQTLVSYVDPKNETLKDLLTTNQLDILLMGEKLLPQTLRQEYSDRMFSCLRRFEYFSCVKYFAWPMIKQYFPALPAFPDYQYWYPVFDFYPQYPIVPFPPLSGEVGELPEVVDADATRSRRPRPEAIIIQVLENTMKQQPRLSATPSFIDQAEDSYIALIPQDQLLTINMAEQLIPAALRQEFVRITVQCIRDYNYLTCMKYSTWPNIRQFNPNLPDFSGILPDFQIPGWDNIVFFPSLPSIPTIVLPQDQPGVLRSSREMETKILNLLLGVKNSIGRTPEVIQLIFSGNVVPFTNLTKSQLEILQLAEYLIPYEARGGLVTNVIVYLQRSDNFIECAKYVIWPTLARYYYDLPEFPSLENQVPYSIAQPEPQKPTVNPGEKVLERVIPEGEGVGIVANRFQDEESRNKVQQNTPVISVTGTSFVPIFTEHPENVIFHIVRFVKLQAENLNLVSAVPTPTTKNQQFLDLINEQQINIVNIVDGLLPESIRTNFTSKLITCLRTNNFLVCTRDVIWPTLSSYFPWIPSFPNFGSISNSSNNATSPSGSSKLDLSESNSNTNAPPLSETDVKTGQHGDTKVTITDTRFVPIFNEVPESVILNILKSVQLSLPNLPAAPAVTKPKDFAPNFLTEQQFNILNIAEGLLPISARDSYVQRINTCLRDKVFLQCVRDVTWPTIGEIYPWLPSFPNFGGYQNMPRIMLHMFLSENSQSSYVEAQASQESLKADGLAFQQAEERIERILLNSLNRDEPKLERAYLDISNPSLSHLTRRQQNIVKLVELGIPDAARATYITRIQECTKGYNFISCTQNISWPTLKQYFPLLPDFSEISGLLPQLPAIPTIPLDPLPALDLPIQNIPGLAELPTGLPPGIAQLPFISQATGQPAQAPYEAQLLQNQGPSAFTPSVDNKGPVPGYAGQPPGIFLDISKERVQLADIAQVMKESEIKRRERRSVVDLTKTYYETDETAGSLDSSSAYPNMSESEYLRLLIKMRERARLEGKTTPTPTSYYADTLNVTIRKSLTADQYEIIKVVEDVDPVQGRGIAQQVVSCIAGLSFIRCVGIFMWPLIVSQFPLLGFFGRSMDTESQVQEFFGMSTTDFEKEMLERRHLIEQVLLGWYMYIVEDKFQKNLGCLKIKGYGNGELGISFSGFREGRGAKLKDNKNLPSILTIISDIMEEVLDQRPEGEKPKREKEKKEKSIDVSREGEFQLLKDSEEYVDIMRSMNDDEIITMFLDKIKTNESDVEDGGKFFDLDDAYNAFEVLFGPRLHSRLAHKSQRVNHKLKNVEQPSQEGSKGVDILSLESQKNSEELKVLPLGSQVTYDLVEESSRDQEQRQRQKRAKNFFKSLLDKHSAIKHLKDELKQKLEDIDNKIVDDRQEKDTKSGLMVKLPKLDEEFLPKKLTNSVIHLGRAMKDKMMQMMPGLGLVFSFLLQMAVAHARAAASMAGMISNMAMGSAIIGMVRDSLFGANSHPQIKYVYDNHKTGPGIVWPANYGSGSHYRGH